MEEITWSINGGNKLENKMEEITWRINGGNNTEHKWRK